MTRCVIAALYGFAPLTNLGERRESARSLCEAESVVGTLLFAAEGVNGTIAGSARAIERVLEHLRSVPGLDDLQAKLSHASQPPFGRLRVRLKKEIVSMGVEGIDPTCEVGTYVEPERWNALLDDPSVLVIDTRNDYEVRIGSFEGAVDPGTKTFRDFPAWASEHVDPTRHKRVAMFCTGGIRCEKATGLLLRSGVEEVLHLRGGVLGYLARIPPERSRWRGECFVFDRRVAVDHHLQPGRHLLCYGCLEPISPEETEHPSYEEGVCCHRCHAGLDARTRAGRVERMKQVRAAKARGEQHLHVGPSPDELQGR